MTHRAAPPLARLTLASLLKLAVAAGAVGAVAVAAPTAQAAAPTGGAFQFGVIGHSFSNGPDETILKHAITEAVQDHPAFIVTTGIKAVDEACNDSLYARRRALLDESTPPMVVSLAGSDWSGCRNSVGRSNAIERLNRLREVFFADDASLGARKLALTRLSSTAKFRSYAENAHWEYGRILFATINLPANNNHFLPEAGRNSEFEDRLVANRAWLHRLFALAERKKLDGVVLFSDGDIGVQNDEGFSLLAGFRSKQDGFTEPRKQIRALAEKFKGKVLLIDTQLLIDARVVPVEKQAGKPGDTAIGWHANIGHLSLGADWAAIRVTPASGMLFSVKGADAAPAQTPAP